MNWAQSSLVEVSPPDRRINLRFNVQPPKGKDAGQKGQLVYSVSFRGKQVFEDSALRPELSNQPLGAAVQVADTASDSGVDDYRLLEGKASAIHDTYNSLMVHALENASPGRKFDIEARVSSSAVAFRYHVPEQPSLSLYQLTREDTEFRPVTDASAWALRLVPENGLIENELVECGSMSALG